MREPALVFNHVWKKFRLGERHDSLRDLVPAAIARVLGRRPPEAELDQQEFWAVRDVTFEARRGDALGIIGPNGAGKSTILKLLTRILKPTRGECRTRGRVGALIEVAAGFHPDLTGRENVFLQGAIMGMKRAEIARKLDAIVEFAGIGEFLDTQVKRYSSGMNARLGFAIAAHLDPDVMIIDEVLSVGDAGYQDKCVRHMRGMVERGVPVVFVSHNLPAVIELCTRALVVRKGAVLFEGEPARAVHEYRQATWAEQPAEAEGSAKAMRIERVELLAGEERSLGVFETGGSMAVRIHYLAARPTVRPHFAVDIHRGDGVYCFGAGTFQRHDFGTVEGAGFAEIRFPRLTLLPGAYTLSVGIHRGDGQGLHDLKVQAYPFSVASDRRELGMVLLDHEWRHEPAAEPALPAGAAKGGPPR